LKQKNMKLEVRNISLTGVVVCAPYEPVFTVSK
jgi:hypothetical protein